MAEELIYEDTDKRIYRDDATDEERVEWTDQDVAQLQALRDKGWSNLTNAEKADLVRLFFEAIRTR